MDEQQPLSQLPVPRPKNWLVESILVTIFCCLPLGIVGIVFSSQVNSKYDAGDIQGALKSSKDAGTWTKVGFFIGLGILVFVVGVSVWGTHHNM
jgi:hypothetical protein